MINNILVTALDFFLDPANIEDPSKYGTEVKVGTVFGRESELTITYVKGAGFIDAVIGESKIKITFDESINRHSFKLSVDNKPAFIVDKDELLIIAKQSL